MLGAQSVSQPLTLTNAACVVRSPTKARSLEDWRGWVPDVNDDLGDELFIVPFAFVLGNPH